MKFNKKGQGALEYLLLIGGAVLIAVIVIALLVGMGSSSRSNTQDTADQLTQQETVIPPYITNIVCAGAASPFTYNIALSEFNLTDYNYALFVNGNEIMSTTTGVWATNPDTSVATGCLDGQTAFVTKTSSEGNSAASLSLTIHN